MDGRKKPDRNKEGKRKKDVGKIGRQKKYSTLPLNNLKENNNKKVTFVSV